LKFYDCWLILMIGQFIFRLFVEWAQAPPCKFVTAFNLKVSYGESH
jgi:hypothetical protein